MKFALTAALALAGALTLADVTAAEAAGGMAATRAACQADLQTLCAGVQPGGGRIMQCLKQNREKLSAGCKSALAERIAEKRAAKANGGAAGGAGGGVGAAPAPTAH
ncbi:cysteine rich repeat-containing protein [Caulobacter sp. KR2-114]|uniref:cysteine rich repeat-containing protein n=1 Tax=Caulobacter sp. KR2-114 TaxID=3400912 RepID=UPI003C09809B